MYHFAPRLWDGLRDDVVGRQSKCAGSEVFTKDDYLKDGWTLVLVDLKMWDRPDMVIFTKVLPAGTKLSLRCNKYQPPVVITF